MTHAFRLMQVTFTAFHAACFLLLIGLILGVLPEIVVSETRLPDGTVIARSTLSAPGLLVYWAIGAGMLGALMLVLRRGVRP